jgi:hypothetical protein
MNIIEAIRSGKRIRRKSKGIWLEPKEGKYFSFDHILADDWEIEEKPVAITREQFDEAWKLVIQESKSWDSHLGPMLAKELGL